MLRRALLPCLVSLALMAPAAASAQAALLTGLGGAADLGENSLAPNDDGSTSFIDLSGAFPAGLLFYGNRYNGVYVNNNGNVSFGAALGSYTPTAFPLPAAAPAMISPWWGDVDTREQTGVGVGNLVYYDISFGRFVATWYDTGYYRMHNDLRVSVQLIITDASAFGIAGAFDVEIRYNRCEWTTGDASMGTGGFGGTPAGAGFDAADGVHYLELPGSRTAAVTALCTTSNVGDPGHWVFQVRPSGVTVCGNAVMELGEGCDDGNVVNGDGCNERCAVELAPGGACAEDIQCRSGFCTDGVCCNARCDGQCEACAEAGAAGTCTAVSGAPRGTRTACTGAGSTCGGSCDGTTRAACAAFPVSGTSCDDGSACSTGDACDGAGACVGVGLSCNDALDCTADACSLATGCSNTLMAGFCVIDGACVAAGTAEPGSQCTICDPSQSTTAWSPRAAGTSCTDGSACTVGDACDASGACVAGAPITCMDDGLGCTAEVCDPATGACGSVVTTGCVIGGACVGEGTVDPANPCMVCNNGKNPLDFSAADMGARCGEPSCSGGNLTPAGACDGMGGCTPGTAMACPDGAACADAMMCASGCTTSAECISGLHCDMGMCVPDLPPGTACTGDSDCGTGFCVDGVCCDTRCNGLCEACNVASLEGTCSPIPAGTDPAMECAGMLACNGMDACEMPATDAGVVDGGARDGGVGPSDAGARDAGGLDAGRLDGGAGADTGHGAGGSPSTNGGCCRAVGSSEHDASGLALSLVGLALLVVRRRRR